VFQAFATAAFDGFLLSLYVDTFPTHLRRKNLKNIVAAPFVM